MVELFLPLLLGTPRPNLYPCFYWVQQLQSGSGTGTFGKLLDKGVTNVVVSATNRSDILPVHLPVTVNDNQPPSITHCPPKCNFVEMPIASCPVALVGAGTCSLTYRDNCNPAPTVAQSSLLSGYSDSLGTNNSLNSDVWTYNVATVILQLMYIYRNP